MEKIPLTMEELRLWTEWKLNPNNYKLILQYKLIGILDVKRLNTALTIAQNFFDRLRSYFVEEDGVPYRVVLPVSKFAIDITDLTQDQYEENDLETIANQQRTQWIKETLILTKSPLYSCKLIKYSFESYYFIFSMPHILGDAYSFNIFLNLLSYIYNNEEDLQKIISKYQNQYCLMKLANSKLNIKNIDLVAAENYWRDKFKNASCQMQFKPHKKNNLEFSGKRLEISLPIALIFELKKLADAERTTLFNILAAAISIFLYRYFGEEDICLNYSVNTRPKHKYAKQLFGFFVNELGLRTQLSGKLTFREVLSIIMQQRIVDQKYKHYPLIEMLIKKLRIDNSFLKFPFNVGLVKTSFFRWKKQALKDINIQPIVSVEHDGGLNDLLFLYEDSVENQDQLEFVIDYNSSIFQADLMQRMALHLTQLLWSIVESPWERIDKLCLSTKKERHQLLIDWNQTEAWFPDNKTIHELFEKRVEEEPDAVALIFEDRQLTYLELNEQANQLAYYLRNLGVIPESLVAICLGRSFEMVIGILGILKAGGAYVPLDPEYPEERLQFMLEDTQAVALITHSHFNNKFSNYLGRRIILEEEQRIIAAQPVTNLIPLASFDNLAYVIYTSGTTGLPKGVMIEQRSVVNMVYAHIKEFSIKPKDIVLQFARFIFDASLPELFATLLAGAKVCLISQTIKLIGESLLAVLKMKFISILTVTPSVLETLPLDTTLPALRLLVVAGEAASVAIIKKWSQYYRMMNVYGPTEATVSASIARIDLNKWELSIGKPIANTKIYILDKNHQPVPLGVVGELCIGGAGLARGYLNQEELTKERFIENPFVRQEDKQLGKNLRLYLTGDLAQYLPDGNIVYVGRADYQVNLRGYRIELGEIESILRLQPDIKEVVAIIREDIPNQKRLVVYFVLQNKNSLEEAEKINWLNRLHRHLEERLPAYMIPSAFMMVLEQLPLTMTGKLARHNLPIPDLYSRVVPYVSPQTELEKQLTDIWSELFEIEEIGVHDNFFRIGGHSLLALRLVRLIEKKLGQKVSLANVFKYPTIKSLADFLQANNEILPDALLSIQPIGKLPPLFLVHPAGGLSTPYLSLLFDNREQPIYGINNPYMNRQESGFSSLEEMAAAYVDIVQTVQNTGPYRLGGWSFGGIVSLEMARQLQSKGKRVEIVVLMDTNAKHQKTATKEDKSLEKLEPSLLESTQSIQEKEMIQREFYNAVLLLSKYEIKYYEQRVILLKATENKTNQFCNGWEVYLPKLEVYSVNGQHSNFLYGDSAQEISVKLNEILSNASPVIFESKKLSFFERLVLEAAARNDTFLIKLALEKIKNLNINIRDDLERTLLHWAAYHGNSELINILLEYNPLVDMTDTEGNTPIMLAKNHADTEIGDKELKIALQLEKMGYIHYKTEIAEKLKLQNERRAICNKLKLYCKAVME
ncbi:MAG: amino acid adenylation domain-containing protein [Candidatus Aquirickettsiella sp.]